MPHLYLTRWQLVPMPGDPGLLHWATPFEADNLERIDLSTEDQQASSNPLTERWCLAVYRSQVTLPPGSVYLGSENLVVPQREKDAIRSRLQIGEQLEGATLESIMHNLLTLHADAQGQTRTVPLQARTDGSIGLRIPGLGINTRRRLTQSSPEWPVVRDTLHRQYRRIRQHDLDTYPEGHPEREHYKRVLDTWRLKYRMDYRVFIPMDLEDEGILPHRSTFNETWNSAANSDNPDGDLDWTEVVGDWDVVSNHIRDNEQTANNSCLRCESALDGDDHYTQFVGVSIHETGSQQNALVRFAAAAATLVRGVCRPGNDDLFIQTMTSGGSPSTVSSTSFAHTPTETVKLEVNGSDLTLYLGGTSRLTGTSSVGAGNVRGGLGGRGGGRESDMDTVEIADLAAGTPSLIHNIPARIYQHMLNR